MEARIEQAVEQLREAGVRLLPALSESECSAIERHFGFRFGREHRALLRRCLPVGNPDGETRGHGFWNWRDVDSAALRRQLDWPVDGVLFDVEYDAFWDPAWGRRPDGTAQREAVVRAGMARVPTLIPLAGHDYMLADPAPEPCPVFSVWQTDVIYFGWDLNSFLDNTFHVQPLDYAHPPADLPDVEFWGQFV